jgi:hypothetical protein
MLWITGENRGDRIRVTSLGIMESCYPPPRLEHRFSTFDTAGDHLEGDFRSSLLGAIALDVATIVNARAHLDELVTSARLVGMSWAKIGEAAGISRQAAHERWSKVLNARLAGGDSPGWASSRLRPRPEGVLLETIQVERIRPSFNPQPVECILVSLEDSVGTLSEIVYGHLVTVHVCEKRRDSEKFVVNEDHVARWRTPTKPHVQLVAQIILV